MKKAVLLAVIFSWMTDAGFGQNQLKFRSTEWLGFSAGEVGSAFQVQTVNGVSKGPWFAGVGAGIDYYLFRSAPLFLSVTRDIALGKKDWLFLYVDGGTNLPWYTRPLSSLLSPTGSGYSSSFHSGGYYSGGVGYLWKLGANTSKAVLFTAGYTVKKLTEDRTGYSGICPPLGPCDLDAEAVKYEYLCRAYQFMIGFRF